jgi:hypothetical protein
VSRRREHVEFLSSRRATAPIFQLLPRHACSFTFFLSMLSRSLLLLSIA